MQDAFKKMALLSNLKGFTCLRSSVCYLFEFQICAAHHINWKNFHNELVVESVIVLWGNIMSAEESQVGENIKCWTLKEGKVWWEPLEMNRGSIILYVEYWMPLLKKSTLTLTLFFFSFPSALFGRIKCTLTEFIFWVFV